jgi:hypothetical protein
VESCKKGKQLRGFPGGSAILTKKMPSTKLEGIYFFLLTIFAYRGYQVQQLTDGISSNLFLQDTCEMLCADQPS